VEHVESKWKSDPIHQIQPNHLGTPPKSKLCSSIDQGLNFTEAYLDFIDANITIVLKKSTEKLLKTKENYPNFVCIFFMGVCMKICSVPSFLYIFFCELCVWKNCLI
jgi:hypothetical protein